MLLHSLLKKYDDSFPLDRVPDIEILGIEEDSRLVRTGDLFIARAGTATDGIRFAADAQKRGAVAVIVPAPTSGLPLPQVVLADRGAASRLANLYHGRPSTKLKVIGVTGTNGKTTTTYLIRHILAKVGQRCGMIGTVQIDDGRNVKESELTTPGPVVVADLLAAMRDHGCRACAIETSSHALDQGRVAGVEFAGAGFTNLTGDHLDYHKTMDGYASAKAILFDSLAPGAVACINADDPAGERMARDCKGRVVRFSMNTSGNAEYRATDIAITSAGTHFVLVTPDGSTEVHMQLIGRHNIQNALCAASLLSETMGLNVHQIAAGLKDALGAPGRLQPVKAGQPFAVLVDYAHTDDALANVLSALRPLTRGKLRVVFGCGGDRDRTKRPRMAAIAEKFADAIYVTSDNPRTEPPGAILDEIVAGFSSRMQSSDKLVVNVDRRAAIARAMEEADADDVVLVAGKGHENYQIVGTTKHHFDDVEECTRAIAANASMSAA